MMDTLIQQFLEFLKSIADRSGTKFIIALGAIGALWHLATIDKIVGLYAMIGIVIIAGGFFVFRYFENSKKNGGQT